MDPIEELRTRLVFMTDEELQIAADTYTRRVRMIEAVLDARAATRVVSRPTKGVQVSPKLAKAKRRVHA